MFLLFLIRGSLVLSVFTTSSSALPSPLKLISSPLNLPASLRTRALNTTSVQDLEVLVSPHCNPSYGRNLNSTSCDNALAKISEVTTPLTFGQRDTGDYDVVLPRRYLSGTLSLEPSRWNWYSAAWTVRLRIRLTVATALARPRKATVVTYV